MADENLGAAILVEIKDAWLKLHALDEEEVHSDALAGASRTDKEGVAHFAAMPVEEVGRARDGLEQRDRRPPVVTGRLPARIVGEGGKSGEVCGTDERGAQCTENSPELRQNAGSRLDPRDGPIPMSTGRIHTAPPVEFSE